MPEMIDRHALLKKVYEHPRERERMTDGEWCRKCIYEAPKVEAEPVRHGRMIEGRYPNENKCSECGKMFRDDIGFIIQDDDGVFHYPKRCPECGCYWDGGADND